MSKLTGKRALVTGGGSGIGLAVARLFLHEGARVAITGRDEAKLRRAADDLAAGDRLIYRACDVSEPAQVEAAVRHVTERRGGIDVLVNNAGTNIKERGIRQLTPEKWRLLIGFEPGRCVLLRPRRAAANGGAQGRRHRQRLLGGGQAGRAARRGGLRRRQVRHERPWASAWPRKRRTAACASATSTRARSIRRFWKCGRRR